VVLVPAARVRDAGLIVSAKSGWAGGVTTSVPLAVRVKLPLTPVTVSAKLPVGVLGLVVTVRVEEVPVAGLGLRLPLAPTGRPLTLRLTEPEKPPVRLTPTV